MEAGGSQGDGPGSSSFGPLAPRGGPWGDQDREGSGPAGVRTFPALEDAPCSAETFNLF